MHVHSYVASRLLKNHLSHFNSLKYPGTLINKISITEGSSSFVSFTYLLFTIIAISWTLFDSLLSVEHALTLTFLFVLVCRTYMQIRNLLHAHIRNTHILWTRSLCSCGATRIDHHTLCKLSWRIEITISKHRFRPIPHITLISHIHNFLNNLRNILDTDFINGKPCLFNIFDLVIVLRHREVINPLHDILKINLVLNKWFSYCPDYQTSKRCPRWCNARRFWYLCVS